MVQLKVNKETKLQKTKKLKKNVKKKKVKPKQENEKFSKMSYDNFLDNLDNDESESEAEVQNNSTKKGQKIKNHSKKVASVEKSTPSENEDSENEDANLDPIAHKKALSKLKVTDPEFYKFLEDNDKKLLDFDLNEDADSDDDDDDAVDDDRETEDVHKPVEKLEVASDESDYEPDEDSIVKAPKDVKGKITLKMLKQWREDLQTDKTPKTISCVIRAFHAALLRVSSDEEQKEYCEYTVDGSAVFNGVIQICVLDLQPAIKRYLKIQPGSKQPPHKCKRFSKIRQSLKEYLKDLVKLLSGVTSNNILNVLLKHIHHLSPMVVSFGNIAKILLKRLIKFWGTQEDTVRVVAFLCILRITNNQRASYLDMVLKKMYKTYVINSKFVSPSTLPAINFMRRSLVEMFALDLNFSYQHVFLYIRQLAIHLRNAITLKRKENIQAVYNWQYVNSIHLWAELLAVTCRKPQLQQLIYPLTQVCIGTIKLIPTAQYFPLRFHCIEILTKFSRDTEVYIPVLPLIYEVLSTYNFNKKHKKVSMKPIDFTCLLRLSKSQLSENGFKDAVIENVYALLLQYLATQAHSIAFPDLVLPCIFEIKKFLKVCPVANYCKKMRQILEKIEENSKMIENERKSFTYTLDDQKQIKAWETKVRNKTPPLLKFYESWQEITQIQKKKRATKNDEIGEYNLPTITKRATKRPHSTEGDSEQEDGSEKPVELFPSDSENDEISPNLGPKPKRGKRGSKARKKDQKNSNDNGGSDDERVNDAQDIVLDTKASDW